MVTRHRPGPAQRGQFEGDSRDPTPHRAGLPRRGRGGRRAREWGRGLRPGPSKILDFRGIQQMPAAPVVGRAEHGAARARRRSENWHAAVGGAEVGAGASHEAGNLPGARRRTPSAKKAAGANYEQKLRRTLERHFPGFAITRLTTGIDLEKPFAPIYARGLLRQGQSAFAVLGVNASETQASIDAALTLGSCGWKRAVIPLEESSSSGASTCLCRRDVRGWSASA